MSLWSPFGFLQKPTQKQGLERKEFTWEVVAGTTGWAGGKRDGEEEKANPWGVIEQASSVGECPFALWGTQATRIKDVPQSGSSRGMGRWNMYFPVSRPSWVGISSRARLVSIISGPCHMRAMAGKVACSPSYRFEAGRSEF